jgi:phosphoribosyl-dephospho-CoA transferase
MQRHDLAYISCNGWDATLAAQPDLVGNEIISRWIDACWPLIVRRGTPGQTQIALGLPLPPAAGKTRLAFLMDPEHILFLSKPPELCNLFNAAPCRWRPTLECVLEIATRHAVETRVFGSLAWHFITEMSYLSAGSDLDLLFYVRSDTELDHLAADLAEIDIVSPVRIDGELIRPDGAAVNWREVHSGAPQVLVKTCHGVDIIDRNLFCAGQVLL